MPKYKVTFEEINGEHSYHHEHTIEAEDCGSAYKAAEDLRKEWWPDGQVQEDDHYWTDQRIIEIYGVNRITPTISDIFTEEELQELLEVARFALADADIYDIMAQDLDLSDDYLKPLIEKLQKFMDPAVPNA